MEQVDLASGTKFILKENVLAVISDNALKTVSSAIFNGGSKQVKAVLNVGVPEGYNDRSLHLDPLELITSSAAKLGLTKDYLAMVTAANVHNYSLFTKKSRRLLRQRRCNRRLQARGIFRRRNGCSRNHRHHKHHRFNRRQPHRKLHGRRVNHRNRSQNPQRSATLMSAADTRAIPQLAQ